MIKFGTQGFLNPVDSEDNGWWKFSIRQSDPEDYKDYVGHVSAKFIVADCSNQSHLEFQVGGLTTYRKVTKAMKDRALADVRNRRRRL